MNALVCLASRAFARLAPILAPILLAGGFAMALKIPLDKIVHPQDDVVNRVQGNVERALQKVTATTLDHWNDGTQFRRVLGVNAANLLTSSGIALYTIVDSNMASGTLTAASIANGTITDAKMASATLTNASIAAGTVTVDNLATANQFSVYRNAAFNCGAGAYSPLIADRVVKDVSAGYSQVNGIFTLPSSGDWQFQWSMGLNTLVNSGKEAFSVIVINSGVIDGNVGYSSAASQYFGSVGSYLYCNALAGDKITLRIFNGDTVTVPMAVGSGSNFFQGYRVR